jgi:hypothetical protein
LLEPCGRYRPDLGGLKWCRPCAIDPGRLFPASPSVVGSCQELEAFIDDAGSRPPWLHRVGRGRRGGGEAEECRSCDEHAQAASPRRHAFLHHLGLLAPRQPPLRPPRISSSSITRHRSLHSRTLPYAVARPSL